jgi:hypothetical protein
VTEDGKAEFPIFDEGEECCRAGGVNAVNGCGEVSA